MPGPRLLLCLSQDCHLLRVQVRAEPLTMGWEPFCISLSLSYDCYIAEKHQDILKSFLKR